MIYNKIFQYENKGIQKRFVTVQDNLKVETQLIPKFGLPLVVIELSVIGKEYKFRRINPYKFDTTTDRHVYIEYAEQRNNGYEIIRKMIIRKSNQGNFKIPEGTYLFDVLDYFMDIGMLDKDYNFIGKLNENIGMSVIELVDKETLINQGFKVPV